MRIRQIGFTMLALVATVGLGCGSSKHPLQQDGGQHDAVGQTDRVGSDVIIQKDSGPDAQLPCEYDSNLDCGMEFTACTAKGLATSECGGLDCVQAPYNPPYNLMCLRPCTCTGACGADTFCLPKSLTSYVQADFSTLAGHCFWSMCGADTGGNGDPLGECKIGGDAYLKQTGTGAFTDTKPGQCYPYETTPGFGQCLPTGTSKRGATDCTFDTTTTCVAPTDYKACEFGSLCIGSSGAVTGTCAKICDPSVTGFDPTVTGACAQDTNVTHDQFCQDSSGYNRATDGTPSPGYLGFCVDDKGCDILSTTDQCVGVATPAVTCYPTSEVSSNGICGLEYSATNPAIGLCNATTNPTPCAAGYICVDSGDCLKYCGLGVNVARQVCPTGFECGEIFFDTPPDPPVASDYPVYLGWGACQPIPPSDGGVGDGATD